MIILVPEIRYRNNTDRSTPKVPFDPKLVSAPENHDEHVRARLSKASYGRFASSAHHTHARARQRRFLRSRQR